MKTIVQPLPECVEIKKYRSNGYTVRLFDTGKTNHQGRSVLSIQIKQGRKVIYQQNGFCPSPLHADDSLEAVASALGFASYFLENEELSLLADRLKNT